MAASLLVAASAPTQATAKQAAEEESCGTEQIRTDVSGKHMRATVELCASTDGRSLETRVKSVKCELSSSIAFWWSDFGFCKATVHQRKIHKGGVHLGQGDRVRYAGPGTYAVTVDLTAGGSRGSGTKFDPLVEFGAEGRATYHLDFTSEGKPGPLLQGIGQVAHSMAWLESGNNGALPAVDTVLRLDTKAGAAPVAPEAASALTAYHAELQRQPRDAARVAEARQQAAAFPDNQRKHTRDKRCLSNSHETVCDLGTLAPGSFTVVDFRVGRNGTGSWEWQLSAGNDPEGTQGRF